MEVGSVPLGSTRGYGNYFTREVGAASELSIRARARVAGVAAGGRFAVAINLAAHLTAARRDLTFELPRLTRTLRTRHRNHRAVGQLRPAVVGTLGIWTRHVPTLDVALLTLALGALLTRWNFVAVIVARAIHFALRVTPDGQALDFPLVATALFAGHVARDDVPVFVRFAIHHANGVGTREVGARHFALVTTAAVAIRFPSLAVGVGGSLEAATPRAVERETSHFTRVAPTGLTVPRPRDFFPIFIHFAVYDAAVAITLVIITLDFATTARTLKTTVLETLTVLVLFTSIGAAVIAAHAAVAFDLRIAAYAFQTAVFETLTVFVARPFVLAGIFVTAGVITFDLGLRANALAAARLELLTILKVDTSELAAALGTLVLSTNQRSRRADAGVAVDVDRVAIVDGLPREFTVVAVARLFRAGERPVGTRAGVATDGELLSIFVTGTPEVAASCVRTVGVATELAVRTHTAAAGALDTLAVR